MKFLTENTAKKLRAGNTVWRCQIGPNGKVRPVEILLTGPKTYYKFGNVPSVNSKTGKPRIPGRIATRIGGRFLSGLYAVPCFTRRKDALKFQATVNNPEYEAYRKHATEHWAWCAENDIKF